MAATGQYFFHEKPFFAELGINFNHSIRQYELIELDFYLR